MCEIFFFKYNFVYLLLLSSLIKANLMSLGKMLEKIPLHYKCRNSTYPRSNHQRYPVPDDKVSWDVSWPEYHPINYTSPVVHNKPWADPAINDVSFKPKWNSLDGDVNRKSHFTTYSIVNGLPINPCGRTGVTGRGVLGRWGPNHAADPILTRWKRNLDNVIVCDEVSKKPILQFVGIERRDCKEWAIPGGMVDPNETVTTTLKREFLEEAMNILSANESEKKEKQELVEKFFTNGLEIYKGYVDDPRNTDNAWMETVATNFHDEDDVYTAKINLNAGDDASKVKWIDINSKLNLYASHLNFIFKVAQIRNCHW